MELKLRWNLFCGLQQRLLIAPYGIETNLKTNKNDEQNNLLIALAGWFFNSLSHDTMKNF